MGSEMCIRDRYKRFSYLNGVMVSNLSLEELEAMMTSNAAPWKRGLFLLDSDQKLLAYQGFSSAPDFTGTDLGTLTDGDVLWGLKELNFPSLYQMEEIPVMQVKRSRDNKPVHVNVDMEGLLEKVSAQNFVPVIDDEKVFIGIITRRDVIHYLAKQCRSREESAV